MTEKGRPTLARGGSRGNLRVRPHARRQAGGPLSPSVDHPRIMADEFARALVDAGVIEDLGAIHRVVIDARAGQPVALHVEYLGDLRLLDVAEPLAGVQVIDARAAAVAEAELARATRRGVSAQHEEAADAPAP